MRVVKSGSQFRKDLKRYRKDKAKLEKLYDIVGYLNAAKTYPKSSSRICFRGRLRRTHGMSCGE